ncbi:MAG TPA: esterase family protein, partial [Mycobacterium sp.]|nr:esterase family protein [Mycobacterium sp.]
LFGGSAAAYAAFDPTTVMARHGTYTGVAGWFDINGNPSAQPHVVNAAANPNDQTAAANSLCATGSANGITCAVEMQPGKHDWPFAARAFAAGLPWLAGQLGTPGVPAVPMPPSPQPTSTPAPPHVGPNLQAAAK